MKVSGKSQMNRKALDEPSVFKVGDLVRQVGSATPMIVITCLHAEGFKEGPSHYYCLEYSSLGVEKHRIPVNKVTGFYGKLKITSKRYY